LVFDVGKAGVGAAVVGVWTGMDNALLRYCDFIWHGVLPGIYGENPADGGAPVCAQPRL